MQSSINADGKVVKMYKNDFDCFSQTLRHEGARGLWKGLGPAFMRQTPQVWVWIPLQAPGSHPSLFTARPDPQDGSGGYLTCFVGFESLGTEGGGVVHWDLVVNPSSSAGHPGAPAHSLCPYGGVLQSLYVLSSLNKYPTGDRETWFTEAKGVRSEGQNHRAASPR